MNNKLTPTMKEFEKAWNEYFKDRPNPKTDEEEKKEQEGFYHWYNYVRQQSYTGKTPAEMYKERYGKEPQKNPTEISRMMNFEWDEEYDESDFNDEDDEEFSKETDNLLNSRPKKCSSCKNQILVPDEKVNNFKKYLCSDCYEKMNEVERKGTIQSNDCYIEINGEDFIKKEIDLANSFAEKAVEDIFPKLWQDKKEELKSMSKKELAEIMFFEGVFTAVANFIHLPNKIDVNEEHNET